MAKKYFTIISVFLVLISSTVSCKNNDSSNFKVNKSHLDYLYEEIAIKNMRMGIIHIYSDYPSYKFVEAKGEGHDRQPDRRRGRRDGDPVRACAGRR